MKNELLNKSTFDDVQSWLSLSDQQMRLAIGEATGQEIRTVRAVLGAIVRNNTLKEMPEQPVLTNEEVLNGFTLGEIDYDELWYDGEYDNPTNIRHAISILQIEKEMMHLEYGWRLHQLSSLQQNLKKYETENK